jgi:deoxycytidine triphosphate deaminase
LWFSITEEVIILEMAIYGVVTTPIASTVALGYYHVVMVTMKGSVFGFGRYHQLGVVDPIALSGWKHGKTVMPTEVFAGVIKSKGAARLPNSKEQ